MTDRCHNEEQSDESMSVPFRAPSSYQLTGLIERVTFFSEESGFCVLQVKAEGHRDMVTVVGSAPTVSAGEWLMAEGDWVIDKQHGRQLKAFQLRTMPPNTREGMEKYLGSGMVKGIGPVYAKKLIARFGEELFEVIEKTPNSLEQVSGIGPKRKLKITQAWGDQRAIRDIMLFLHSHGVGTSRAVRIHKTYGTDSIQKVRTNPYILAEDIPGIGFKTSDDVAQKLGIPRDSIYRACAGLRHVLVEASRDGHCALPGSGLLAKTVLLLEIAAAVVEQALSQMVTKGDLVFERIGSEDLVFLPYLARAEREIAQRIAQLSRLGPGFPAIDFERAAVWCEQRTGKHLAPRSTRRFATGARQSYVSRHGRTGGWQDNPGLFHHHDSSSQEGAVCTLRSYRPRSKAAEREHRFGGKNHSSSARSATRFRPLRQK
jgi:exodeoxyribonuclease V alpha subunit